MLEVGKCVWKSMAVGNEIALFIVSIQSPTICLSVVQSEEKDHLV